MARFTFKGELLLPESLRRDLGRVYGKVIQTGELGRYVKSKERVFAVGDVVVSTLLGHGYLPTVSIFDYRTARGRVTMPLIRSRFRRPIAVRSKRGTISLALWNAVREAAASKRKGIGIRVYGEEDLASLACVYFAPLGSIVMYGLRGKGMHMVRVDARLKRLVAGILLRMREESLTSS